MKITYISQTCPPEPGATRRPLEQAKVLAGIGHEVTLITAFPSYPLGRVFSSYRYKLWSCESVDGVRLIRVWSATAPNRGVLRRSLAFLSFAVAATIAGLFSGRPDAVLGSIPKPFTELAAWSLARIKRAVFVIELRDVLPDSLTTAGYDESGFWMRALDRYYRWMYTRTDIFAVANRWMTPVIASRSTDKTVILSLPHAVDPPDAGEPKRDVRQELGLTDRVIVTYAGSFSSYYKLPLLLDVGEVLMSRLPCAALVLVGTGADYEVINESVENRKIDNTFLIGGIAPVEVAAYLAASDLFIHPQCLPKLTDGTKILEYLFTGRPILNICIHPDAKGQAERLGVGVSISPDRSIEMANAIEYFAQNKDEAGRIGRNSRKLVRDRFCRRSVVTEFSSQLIDAVHAINRGKKDDG